MTIRDEYEYLKTELMIQLTDATVMCNLDFPFDLKIPPEEENRYFIRGAQTRLAMKRSMIILENTYKKVRLFPSKENADAFVEVRDGILEDCKKDVMFAFHGEEWRHTEDNSDSFEKYLDELLKKVKQSSEPFVEMLRTLTPKDIEKEIKLKDNLKKLEKNPPIPHNDNPAEDNSEGVF